VRDYDGTEYTDVESLDGFAAVPDAFQRLWTPHRIAYIEAGQKPGEDVCPFCIAPTLSDEQALIVARGTHAFVLLNLFPYNSGHLLVCPYRHVSTYDQATDEEVAEIASLTQTAMRVLTATSRAHGYNVVPRWAQDSNFFPIIAGTKALPRLLGDVRAEVAAAWPA
jgi:ATP adenylyltransferase